MTWNPPTPFEWNHCGTCGARLVHRDDGERPRPYCAACNRFFYRNPVPACCVFARDAAGALLFAQRDVEPHAGRWTLPGGFMESGETGEECVLRELMEETGLRGFGPRLLGATLGKSALYDSVLVLGYVLDRWEGVPEPGSDARDLRFFSRDERPDVPFRAHRELLQIYDGLRP